MSDTETTSLLRAYWTSALYNSAERFRRSNAVFDFHVNQTFEWLMIKYQERHRKYHNLSHLVSLFGFPDVFRPDSDVTKFFCEKTLFFFFHDCIYDIPAIDNEQASAKEARERMVLMGFHTYGDDSILDFVCSAIELSNHASPCDDVLQQELLDYDLAILGTEPSTYLKYTLDVRAEYSAVPQDVWNEKRGEFLNYMLNKPHIFQTEFFQKKYEKNARQNMTAEYVLLENV
jgi:predicted metal-dependent HD superfamily phosphohydrolase